MKQSEIIRLYHLLEDLNEHFHQEANYTNKDKSEVLATKIYPEIRTFYYDIVRDMLPEDYQKDT